MYGKCNASLNLGQKNKFLNFLLKEKRKHFEFDVVTLNIFLLVHATGWPSAAWCGHAWAPGLSGSCAFQARLVRPLTPSTATQKIHDDFDFPWKESQQSEKKRYLATLRWRTEMVSVKESRAAAEGCSLTSAWSSSWNCSIKRNSMVVRSVGFEFWSADCDRHKNVWFSLIFLVVGD